MLRGIHLIFTVTVVLLSINHATFGAVTQKSVDLDLKAAVFSTDAEVFDGRKVEIGNDDLEGKSKELKKRDVYETCGKTCPIWDPDEQDPYRLYDFKAKGAKVYIWSLFNKDTRDLLNLLEQSYRDIKAELRKEGQLDMVSLHACTNALWMYRAVFTYDTETAKGIGDAQQRTSIMSFGVKVRNLRNLCIGRCLAMKETDERDVDVVMRALQAGILQTENFAGVSTEFRLYTRANPKTYQVINRKDPSSLKSSWFDRSSDTKFIIHGYRQNGASPFVIEMKNALLSNADYNVISVDWQEGAGSVVYFPSARNVYIVGDTIDLFIRFLNKEVGYSYKRVHLIGFSLGAQCSGQAGMRNPSIGRITGLDPASPNFEKEDISKKLDASDAQFVDVIHTDGDTYGTWEPTGDVDFYPNGGKDQPGCTNIGKDDASAKGDILSCDHGKAPEYFIKSITSDCNSLACPCQLGHTCTCSSGQNYMGFYATESPKGTFYLKTHSACTQFRLYTRANRNSYQVINRKDPSSLTYSSFNPLTDTKFIIHGFTQDGASPFVIDMKNALLSNADYNVISVDWQEGAGNALYYPSARNVYIVGDIMDLFIRFLNKEVGYSYKRVHLIGFSLGAQCSGQAGMRNPSIGRITGLDPAKPNFETKDKNEKLDATDAQFVDVIHTDGDTLGTWEPTGDVDFYPNGGKDQPGCFNIGKRDVSAKGGIGCDHGKAPEYFIKSITSSDCNFLACPCPLGQTCTCSSGQNYMGFYATESPKGTFYLETRCS
ncbi:uncharacterized protein [Ptychodera flava]|uniref:uncharacterized protein n=1 Tax=Ptychodera flava TaxID=63121 RepID=UPI00396A83EB